MPDIVAMAATPSGDGIVNLSGTNGVGAFAVATVNVGAGDAFTVSADTGGASLPVQCFRLSDRSADQRLLIAACEQRPHHDPF